MIKAMIRRLHSDRDNNIKRTVDFRSGFEPDSSVLELAKRDGYDVETLETVTAFRSLKSARPALPSWFQNCSGSAFG
jgi:hypothetical protein